MEVFVHRSPRGFETSDMDGIEELEERLKGIDTFKPFDESEEVTMEVKAPWWQIRQLLSQPLLMDIWFDPTRARRT